jgi:hypothetical protein
MHSVQELAFYIYIYVYVLITGISLYFEKQQHGNLLKQGIPCKLNREIMCSKQEKDVIKAGKTLQLEHKKFVTNTGKSL